MTSKKAKKVSENDNMNESDDSSSDQSDSGSELAENHEVNVKLQKIIIMSNRLNNEFHYFRKL